MPSNTVKLTPEVVTKVLALLRKEGWCKRRFQNSKGAHCLHGAFNEVIHADAYWTVNDSVMQPLLDLFVEMFPRRRGSWTSIPQWNDSKNRSFEDVEKVLNRLRNRLRYRARVEQGKKK